jgi:hypothetical protein
MEGSRTQYNGKIVVLIGGKNTIHFPWHGAILQRATRKKLNFIKSNSKVGLTGQQCKDDTPPYNYN